MPPRERLLFEPFAVSLFLHKHSPAPTPKLKARVRETGLDLDKPLLPGYPAELLPKWLQIAAEELHPHLPTSEAYREIGRQFVRGWQETLIGKAAAGVLRVIGPRRALHRVNSAFRTGDNFVETQAEDLGPTKVRMRFNEVSGAPDYYAGVLHEGGVLTRAKNPRVTVESHDRPGAVLIVEWEE
ncbi:MAG: DUF2378 family protein [Myxococcaceae bacterium]